jgi:8-oxo-dGTP pyrophosphatase MutT (NUDIX family)
MYVTREILARAEAALGTPVELHMQYEITPPETAMIRRSQRHGRAHDVTTFLFADEQLAVIAKHNYPPGIYRVPGGGLQPGEELIDGAVREALEETGLPFTPTRYALRVFVAFTCGDERIDWVTHVVAGTAPPMQPRPVDTREIREAQWIAPAALLGPIAELMLATGRPLLRYRTELHRRALDVLTPLA